MIASRLIWLNNLRLRLDVLKNSFVTRTTMTKPLSPATQAVLDAAVTKITLSKKLAAALRAAADQVVPEQAEDVGDSHDEARHDQWMRIRYRFLAIAAELEAQ
jgi:hypothetical protein